MSDTGYLTELLTKTQAGYKWCLDFFGEVYRRKSAGQYDEDQFIKKFKEIASKPLPMKMPFGGTIEVEDIDWSILYHNCLKATKSLEIDIKNETITLLNEKEPIIERKASTISKHDQQKKVTRLYVEQLIEDAKRNIRFGVDA